MGLEITLPKLSDTMEEGTVLRWLKQAGDTVRRGDVIVEVETDKADMEVESEHAGVIEKILVDAGQSVAVGTVLAVLEEGASTDPKATEATPAVKTPAPKKPVAVPDETKPIVAVPDPPADPSEPPTRAPRTAGIVPPPGATRAKPPASSPRPAKSQVPAPASAAEPDDKAGVTVPAAKSDKLRSAVAKQMVASKRDIPHFYVTCEIDMDEAVKLRQSLSETPAFPERLTYTHLVLRALATTLPRHPRVNAWYVEDGVVLHEEVHLGIAVAVEGGLIAPVLNDCRKRSLRDIARATATLVEQAQSGRSKHLSGATFTLSNLGMLEVEEFCAVVIPPQAAILAVGSIRERAVVRGGALAVARTMRATLSADHRVLTGYEAGRFLEELKHTLERPAALLLAEE